MGTMKLKIAAMDINVKDIGSKMGTMELKIAAMDMKFEILETKIKYLPYNTTALACTITVGLTILLASFGWRVHLVFKPKDSCFTYYFTTPITSQATLAPSITSEATSSSRKNL